ncbi:armadillo-type protein [Gymnopilus junonius]|uniref:Armadillo-type protein n=1 Tax=Gymnopilus junonius TaxID=109634 RepID=A0A9P5NIG8_GYMJU|nr:armadillo-type protein [Gymnopilus junonius]
MKFFGELFKVQMLTERIMHNCVKKLLGNLDNPEEEEIESLCKLLTTVGAILDHPRPVLTWTFTCTDERAHKEPNVTLRMQFMLQDLLELRERKWIPRNAGTAQEKESYYRQINMPRGGSRGGGDSNEYPQVNPDGWAVAGSGAARPPTKAGDLSDYGQITKGQPITFGPSNIFSGKKGNDVKRESISRTNTGSNIFSMLSAQSAEAGGAAAKPLEPQQHKRLVLQPRTRPSVTETTGTASSAADSGSSSEDVGKVIINK